MTKQPKPGPIQKAIERLPVGYEIKISREVSSEDGVEFMAACLFRNPPEDGWETRGDYFQRPGSKSGADAEPCPESWKYEQAVLSGISWYPGEPKWKSLLINWLNNWADKNG